MNFSKAIFGLYLLPTCTRCQGFISLRTYVDFDPSCINCGCTYPELRSSNGTHKGRGLTETIRYTGSIPHMKKLLGSITYSRHPSRGSVYPMLLVVCPTCKNTTEVISSSANPHSSENATKKSIGGYRVAKESIKCPMGHLFKLKVDREGMYSWE